MRINHILRCCICAFLWLTFGSVVAQQDDEPIRLEVTIKGNKEQPQVLSIVPWQLPEHRTIDGILAWPLKEMELTFLQRKAFMSNVALTRQMTQLQQTNHSSDRAQP